MDATALGWLLCNWSTLLICNLPQCAHQAMHIREARKRGSLPPTVQAECCPLALPRLRFGAKKKELADMLQIAHLILDEA
jgi:hypothetical protein